MISTSEVEKSNVPSASGWWATTAATCEAVFCLGDFATMAVVLKGRIELSQFDNDLSVRTLESWLMNANKVSEFNII